MTPEHLMNVSGLSEISMFEFNNDIDGADIDDPQACAIYVYEIFNHLYNLEVNLQISYL